MIDACLLLLERCIPGFLPGYVEGGNMKVKGPDGEVAFPVFCRATLKDQHRPVGVIRRRRCIPGFLPGYVEGWISSNESPSVCRCIPGFMPGHVFVVPSAPTL